MDEEFVNVDGTEVLINNEGLIFNERHFSKYEILSCAYDCDNEQLTKVWLQIAQNFRFKGDAAFDKLYAAVFELSIYEKKRRKEAETNEFAIQRAFKEKYANKVVDIKHDRHNIPDCWIQEDGILKPVEVKKGNFNNVALYQLKRYLDAYHCEQGIAVGEKCTVKLPDNIKFIPISDFYKGDKNE